MTVLTAGTAASADRDRRSLPILLGWLLGVQALFWLLVLVVRPPFADPEFTRSQISGLATYDELGRPVHEASPRGYYLGAGRNATFAANVAVGEPQAGLVVFTPRYNRSASLRVNGEPVPQVDAPAWRGGRLGAKWAVPARLLHPGANRIAVHVTRECCRAYLSSLHAAPPGAIDRAIREWRLKRLIPAFATAVLGLFGMLACAYIALTGSHRPLAIAAALALGGSALGALWQIDIFTPSSEPLYNWAGQAILVLTLSGIVALADRWFPPAPRFNRQLLTAAPIFLLLATAALFFPDGVPTLWRTLLEAVMAIAANAAVIAAVARGLSRDRRTWAPDAAILLLVPTISLLDLWDSLEKDPLTLTSAPLGVMGLIVMLLFGIVRRGRLLFTTAEQANTLLEERIAAKQRELEETSALLRKREAEAAVQAERGRIMRDMHDGMGGHLLSVLMLARDEASPRKAIADTTQSAIDDLRLLIDSLDSVGDSLDIALGQFRERAETKLRAAGIALIWENRLESAADHYSPSAILSIYRILQEAINNAVRHSGASEVRVSVRQMADGATCLAVSDNGTGTRAPWVKGRGLSNMQQRAQALGGQLELDADETGVSLRLTLPGR